MRKCITNLILMIALNVHGQSEHKLLTALLQKHVAPNGMVDYQSFLQDRSSLQQYLDQLSNTDPNAYSTNEQKLAFWINAYNAQTIALILDNYPLKSITDLHPVIYIPGVASVWNYHFFSINEVSMSLNHIEHKILREKFNEPRIHFAINCASISCPALRNEAFEATTLEYQLEDQTEKFINDTFRNQLSFTELNLSKIFKWFHSDFTNNSTIEEFIGKYSEIEISEKPRIKFMSYNWSLNEI